MTSVVDTSVKFYTSQMDGTAKPNISATAGTIIAAIDACIAGFDSKACTINISGTVATVAWTGLHSCMTDTVVNIGGCTGAWTALNGEQKIVSKTAGTSSATFNVAGGTPTGAVSGSPTIAMAGLPAWSKVFSGTNVAVYRSSDLLSLGMYFRVDDSVATHIRMVGYESMTDVNTGLGAWPTAAQLAGGLYMNPKGNGATSTPQLWALFADQRSIHLANGMFSMNVANNFTTVFHGFGDATAFRPGGDPWMSYICGTNSSNPVTMYGGLDSYTAAIAIYAPRTYTGLGQAVGVGNNPYTGASASGSDVTLGAFPSVIDGVMRISPRIFTQSNYPRGEVPGVYHIPHNNVADSFKTGDRILGTGSLSGKRFFMLNPPTTTIGNNTTSSANSGGSLVDIVGPWR